MTDNSQDGEQQDTEDESNQAKFCQDCGLSLVHLDIMCNSATCEKCGQEVFFVREGKDGGINVKKGEKLHTPQITMSLDPSTGGVFTRDGLEFFIKEFFLGKAVSKDEFIDSLKETEQQIFAELSVLDCISHIDLTTATTEMVEVHKILEKLGLDEYRFKLYRSACIHQCRVEIEKGNALDAAFLSYRADKLKESLLFEGHHLKEIIWLGYSCYVDIVKNEGTTALAAKENKLIKGASNKIRNLGSEFLYALTNDGNDIAPRIALSGLAESTLKSLVQHELDRRERDQRDNFTKEDITIKRDANSIKRWIFFFTIINVSIHFIYKYWIT